MSDPQDRSGFLLPRLSWLRKIGEKSRFIAPQWQAGWKATQIVDSPPHGHQRYSQRDSQAHRPQNDQAHCRTKNSISKSIFFSLGLHADCSAFALCSNSAACSGGL